MIFATKITWINASSYTILSCSAFNSAVVAGVAIFLPKSKLPMNPEISDFLTNSFSFNLLLINLFVDLLWWNVVKYLDSMSDIFASKSAFC